MYINLKVFIIFIISLTRSLNAQKSKFYLVETEDKMTRPREPGTDYQGDSGGADFNCLDECGLYEDDDKNGPTLQDACTAMTESEKCKRKFDDGKVKKKKKKKKKSQGTRIVGGESSSYAMPWMVYITIGELEYHEMCGGSLINTQFVLSAAHCFCNGQLKCSRRINEVGDGPIKMLKEDQIPGLIGLWVGMTLKGGKDKDPTKEKIDNIKTFQFKGKKIFIHPLLGTSKEFLSTPDQALIKMDGKVASFQSHIRPVCLATKDVDEKPFCPDNSADKRTEKNEKKLGGCATVAGWGYRYSAGLHDLLDSSCRTNFHGQSPDKIAYCASAWTVNGKEHFNCTKDLKIPIDDLSKPCRVLTQELEFQKQLAIEEGTAKKTTWTVDEIVKKLDAPVEVQIKTGKRKLKRFLCGRTKFDTKDTQKGGVMEHGWCATKTIEKEENIQIARYGFCDKACMDYRQGFMYANLNILMDEECETLFNHSKAFDKKNDANTDMSLNKEYEICTGKKHKFPADGISFVRRKKKKAVREAEKAKATKLGLKGLKPTKYRYTRANARKFKGNIKTPPEYPYDWFLGGVDSCQGDSGGPLWRNIKGSDGKVRATQIGTVSRGHGCAGFNHPAVFGSVKKSYDWIKEVVEKEMKGEYCPKK